MNCSLSEGESVRYSIMAIEEEGPKSSEGASLDRLAVVRVVEVSGIALTERILCDLARGFSGASRQARRRYVASFCAVVAAVVPL